MGNLALIKNILSPRNHLLRGQNYNNNGYYFLLSFCGWGNWGSERLSNLPKIMEEQNLDLMGKEFKGKVLKEVDQEVLFQWKMPSPLVTLASYFKI